MNTSSAGTARPHGCVPRLGIAACPLRFHFARGRQCKRELVRCYDARGLRLRARSAPIFRARCPRATTASRSELGGATPGHRLDLAEQRRLMVENIRFATQAGCSAASSSTFARRTWRGCPRTHRRNAVRLKPREIGARTGTTSSRSKSSGDAPLLSIAAVDAVDAADPVPRGRLHRDRPADAPNASWGQMLPRFFAPAIAVANHAESGETLKSFVTELRFDKLLSTLQRRRLGDDPVRRTTTRRRSGRRRTPRRRHVSR